MTARRLRRDAGDVRKLRGSQRRPSISACSIPARAGSPASAAISAKAALLAIFHLLDRESAPFVNKGAGAAMLRSSP